MHDGWRKYTKKEIDEMREVFASGKHFLDKVHTLPGFMRNMILKKIAEDVRNETKPFYSEKQIQAFIDYYFETLKLPGMMDLG